MGDLQEVAFEPTEAVSAGGFLGLGFSIVVEPCVSVPVLLGKVTVEEIPVSAPEGPAFERWGRIKGLYR